MADQAHIVSVEMLADLRNALVSFRSEIEGIVDEVRSEVVRTRQWVETDQRTHWEGMVQRRTRELADARQSLLTARMLNMRSDIEPRKVVDKAVRALETAQEKLSRVKWWANHYIRQADLLVKPLDSMRDVVASRVPRAVAYLDGVIRTLDAYTDSVASPSNADSPRPAAPPPDLLDPDRATS